MQIAVWGISKTLKELEKYPYYLDENKIVFYVDSNRKWKGCKYKGKDIVNPEELKSRINEIDFIFIATPKYQGEIFAYAEQYDFINKILPIEIVYPFIERHFNEIVRMFAIKQKVQIVKEWYVENNNRSIIMQIDGQINKKIKICILPKWCIGNRLMDMEYTFINLQNYKTEASGKVDIDSFVEIDIRNNRTILKLTTTGLNSSLLSFEFVSTTKDMFDIKGRRNAELEEKSYNFDFVWHEFDYEFLKHIRWNDNYTILDVGANIGQSTYNFIQHTLADVLMIEANPFFKDLLESIQKEYPNRCKYLSAGVGNNVGELCFYIPKFEADIAQESSFIKERVAERIYRTLGIVITDDNIKDYIEKCVVKVITIDSLIDSYRYPVSFIKIDVENYEFETIKGMSNTIKKYQPIILLEFNSKEQQEKILKYVNEINSYCLNYWDYVNGCFTAENYCASNNYFLLPKEMNILYR